MAKRKFPSPLSHGPKKLASFKANWLSDPSAYPLMLILGSAAAFMVGVGSSCLMYNPDVQLDPNKRGSPMRTWEFG